jgi:hypothetical protein
MNFQGHKTKEQWKKPFATKEAKETKARAKALLAEKEKKSPRNGIDISTLVSIRYFYWRLLKENFRGEQM